MDEPANMGNMGGPGITAHIPYNALPHLLVCPNNTYEFTSVKPGGVGLETYSKKGRDLSPFEVDLIIGTFVCELDKLRFSQAQIGGR